MPLSLTKVNAPGLLAGESKKTGLLKAWAEAADRPFPNGDYG
jgi:hypothetical protein